MNNPHSHAAPKAFGAARKSVLRAAVLLAVTAGASSAAYAADVAPTTPDGTLTRFGVTLYGTVDVGLHYETHGAKLSDYHPAGNSDFIQKNSNGSVTSVNGNNLGQSKIGLKGQEDFGNGWSGVFKLETFFNPWSGNISDGLKSVTNNNGVALTQQSNGVDSSIAGQLFGSAAYLGVSHAQFGTLTFGRQNGLLADGVGKYDPLYASQAFSPIGYSGTAAGGGDTEDRRLDGSIKYEVVVNSVHLGAQFQPKSGTNPGTTTELALGWNFPGGSVDAFYVDKSDAIGAGSLSATGVADVTKVCSGTAVEGYACAAIDKAVAGTISDNTTYGVMGKYVFADKKAIVSAGYEHISFKNPSNLVSPGQSIIAGYTLASANNEAFPSTKTLQVSWIGLKYSPTQQLDLTGAYYRYDQNSYSVAHPGCSDAQVSSQCSGAENFVSFVADYHFTKRFDAYAGAMWSQVNGGLANGFLNTSTIDPTIGGRYSF